MDEITTKLEKKLDEMLARAVDALRQIEYVETLESAKAIAQSCLDDLQEDGSVGDGLYAQFRARLDDDGGKWPEFTGDGR